MKGWAKIRACFKLSNMINKIGGKETMAGMLCKMNNVPMSIEMQEHINRVKQEIARMNSKSSSIQDNIEI